MQALGGRLPGFGTPPLTSCEVRALVSPPAKLNYSMRFNEGLAHRKALRMLGTEVTKLWIWTCVCYLGVLWTWGNDNLWVNFLLIKWILKQPLQLCHGDLILYGTQKEFSKWHFWLLSFLLTFGEANLTGLVKPEVTWTVHFRTSLSPQSFICTQKRCIPGDDWVVGAFNIQLILF